jgi:hypothetical protein
MSPGRWRKSERAEGPPRRLPQRGDERQIMHLGVACKVTLRQRVDLHFSAGLSPEANGRDVCIMKNILDDWDDERCVTILKNCERTMTVRGKVLLAEPGILPSTGSLT